MPRFSNNSSSDDNSVSSRSSSSSVGSSSLDSFLRNLDNEISLNNDTFNTQVAQLRQQSAQEEASMNAMLVQSNNPRVRAAAQAAEIQNSINNNTGSSISSRANLRPSRVPNYSATNSRNTGGRSL